MNTICFETDCFTQIIPVLKRLQEQHALSNDIINVNQYPNAKLINEMIEKLFSTLKEQNINLVILSTLLNQNDITEACYLLNQQLSEMQVMKFSQLILYKVLPCPNGENCEFLPREIATNNQYYDRELACPFYHHYRDQRRLVINDKLQEEFMYQANYYDDDKPTSTKDNYSQNYFESMFHPLYYKMFQCTRKYCKAAAYCPFYHSESEKGIWGSYFLQFINKERVSYVKEKKKGALSSGENSIASTSPRIEPERVMRSPKVDYYSSSSMYDPNPKRSYEKQDSYNGFSNNYSPKNTPRGGNKRVIKSMIRVA